MFSDTLFRRVRGKFMKLIDYLKHKLNPTHCWKHKTKLKEHGWDDLLYCPKCSDEKGYYSYE